MDVDVWLIMGIAAAALTSFGFLPQVFKMWRSKSVGDVSVMTFWQYAIGMGLWTAYGLTIGDIVFTIANIISLTIIWLALTLYYRSRISALENAVLNTVRNAAELGLDPLDMVRRQSHILARSVAESGGDLRAVTREIVSGAMAGARVAGLDPGHVIRASARGVAAGAAAVSPKKKHPGRKAAVEIAVIGTLDAVSSYDGTDMTVAATAGIYEAAEGLTSEQQEAIRGYVSSASSSMEGDEERE